MRAGVLVLGIAIALAGIHCGGGSKSSGQSALTSPIITLQPVSQMVTSHATATFTIAATGNPAPTYQWNLNGVAISRANSAFYATPPTVAGTYSYTVTVSNSAGSVTSAAGVLIVKAFPAIITQPQSQAVTAPAPATFMVVASGRAPLTYQWNENGIAIPGAGLSPNLSTN